MATTATLTLEQFIDGRYDHEWEFVDGELVERRMGDFDHSRVQVLLGVWFEQHEELWSVIVLAEMDTITTPTRFRKPDVAVVAFGATPNRLNPDAPPLVAIEILSPGDTFREMQAKCAEYRAMGTPGIWIIDPETHTGQMWADGVWVASPRLTVPGTRIYLDLDWLFTRLDRSRNRG